MMLHTTIPLDTKPNSPSPSAASSVTLTMEESQLEETNDTNNALNTNGNNTPPAHEQQGGTTNPIRRQKRDFSCQTARRGGTPTSRAREFFVDQEGIDREVITADITLYLGNDALVRPGVYEDPQTGQTSEGYFVTSDLNLTEAMIADLKADSARWENEKQGIFNGQEHPSPEDVEGLPSQILFFGKGV